MKKILFAMTMVAALTLTATAASKKPAPDVTRTGPALPPGKPVVPALCNPCLFYSGDLNPADGQAAGYSDENTLLVSGSSTYAAVNIPKGITGSLTGILFNVQADANFDPQNATYDIRQGVSEGDGGTEVATGTGNITVAATGRVFLGVTEFSVLVTVPTVTLTGGEEYWFNVTPQCTAGDVDGSCYVGRIFFSNTTEQANEQFGHAQPPYELYLNSSYFGYTFTNWCTLLTNNGECRFGSFGLVGTAKVNK
jgi:hypothetical protein